MKNIPKFRIIFWKDIPERMHIIDETNFFPRYFFGMDGLLYENYGTNEEPVWETVYDSDYEIEPIGERRIYTIQVGSRKKWWEFWKESDLEFVRNIKKRITTKTKDNSTDYWIPIKK